MQILGPWSFTFVWDRGVQIHRRSEWILKFSNFGDLDPLESAQIYHSHPQSTIIATCITSYHMSRRSDYLISS